MTENEMFIKYKSKLSSTSGRVDKLGNEIKMLLSFEEYLKLWKDAEKFPNVPYVISRIGDVGNYEVGNVFISTTIRNSAEVHGLTSELDILLSDFSLLYKIKRSQTRRYLKNGTLTMEYIKEYMKDKCVLKDANDKTN